MQFSTINPTTEKVMQRYETMTREEIEEILFQIDNAQKLWRTVDIETKQSLFRKLGEVLIENKNNYAEMMVLEMGKPIKQALAEVEKCAWACEVYADNIAEWLKDEIVEADGMEHRVIYQPLGVILAVMPWNFPLWQVYRFAIPTLFSGNGAILKHSNNVPECALLIERSFKDAGFPQDIFRTILADHRQIENLIGHEIIQGVSLTGSTYAGRKIAEIAGKHLKKVVLELGGSDPFIVLEDVDIDYVIQSGAIFGRTQNNGQSCIAAKRFIVHQKIVSEFSEKFAKKMGELIVDDPLINETNIGPMANKNEFDTLIAQVDNAVASGAKVLTGGAELPKMGYFYPPTVLVNVSQETNVFQEEVFGPVAPIITFSDDEEAIKIANNSQYGLGGSVWSKDIGRAKKIALSLEVGSVFINSMVKSDPRMPFGGIKTSGIGRELGKYGILEFVNIKGYNQYRHL